jgi:prepilin-type N-terminal cleavage/methylation domain-containing protein
VKTRPSARGTSSHCELAPRLTWARSGRSQGVTLLEVLVVLSIIGIVSAIALATSAPRTRDSLQTASPSQAIEMIRRRAIAEQKRVTLDTSIDQKPVTLTALPDGSVLVPKALRDALRAAQDSHRLRSAVERTS